MNDPPNLWPFAISVAIPWLIMGLGYWIAGLLGLFAGILVLFAVAAIIGLTSRYLGPPEE